MADAEAVAPGADAGTGDVAADATTGAGTGTAAGNKFQSAISAWRNVDLTTLVSNLDNTASDIVTYQRDSTVQRKDLAQKTKDFRKLDDAAKLTEIKGLLKAYQTFIDLLTNHSKSVNSAFIQTYNALGEAPDPYPLLEASVDAMLVAEDTLPRVTEENAHLQRSTAALTAQLEAAEAKLQAEVAARQQREAALESRVHEAEQSWTAVLAEKQANWAAKERAYEDKAEAQDRLLSELKASYEVNQRLGHSAADGSSGGEGSGNGDGEVARFRSVELEMVNSDLERTAARLAGVEARNEQLLLELAQAKSAAGGGGGDDDDATAAAARTAAVEDDPAYLQVLSQNSSMVRKLDASRLEKEALKREWEGKLRGLTREVGLLRDEREALRAKVKRWSDYEDVKQELEVLKSIEFSTGDDDDDDDEDDEDKDVVADDAKKKKGGESLEQLLLARNKKLNEEATLLRVSHQDLQARLAKLDAELVQRNADADRLQKLVEKLENDLATVEAEVPNTFLPSSGASVAGTYVSRYAPTGSRRGGGGGRSTSPTSSIISGIDPRYGSGGGGEPMGGGSGILPMITAQRDRFKKRIAQLESELADERRTVSQLRQEIAALQRDNLNLYEKTRYVSSYSRGTGVGVSGGGGGGAGVASASAYSGNPNATAISIGGGASRSPYGNDYDYNSSHNNSSNGGSLDRYRKAYESNLSPFQAFRGRESARAYRRLSFPERVVYSITRMVLASRTSRNLFAAYCVALHVVVFLSLYWLSSADAERHVSSAAMAAAAAAAGAGRGVPAAGAGEAAAAAAGAGAAGSDWQEEGLAHGGGA